MSESNKYSTGGSTYEWNYCPKCGTYFNGLQCHNCQDLEDFIIDYDMKQKGWVCPKCGNVYSPYVKECKKCNKNVSGYTITYTGKYSSQPYFGSDE